MRGDTFWRARVVVGDVVGRSRGRASRTICNGSKKTAPIAITTSMTVAVVTKKIEDYL